MLLELLIPTAIKLSINTIDDVILFEFLYVNK